MKHLFLTIFILLLFVPAVQGKSDNNAVLKKTFLKEASVSQKKDRTTVLWGHVRDSFTKVGIKGVKVTLMTADSTVVDSCTAWRNSNQANDFCFCFNIPAKQQKYILRASHPEYYDAYVNYEIKYVGRNRYFDAPWHYMKRRSSNEYEGGTLGEVTVKATRIKIAYRGDTIVYDASAFKLPDGSMLDALVRQMPGAELKDDGSITINGKKIDYLTLNGKDFFKGQNKIMLDNLPYYTVKDIKVYNRTTDFSKFMGKDMEKREYVMDVNLKKEYRSGYLANMEVGAASSDRYLGRIFGSKFSDHTKITAFANFNNINETRNPENNGDWRPTDAPTGKTTNRSVGLNVQSDGTDTWYKNAFNATVSWNDYAQTTSSQSTRFMEGGDSYALSDASEKRRNRQIAFTNEFSLQLPVWLNSYTSFRISDVDSWVNSRSAGLHTSTDRYGDASQALDSVFAEHQPQDIMESLVNRTLNRVYGHGRQIYAYQKFVFNGKLPWGDNLELEVNGEYNDQKNKTYSDYRLDYSKNAQQKDDNKNEPLRDYRNIYRDTPVTSYRWEARAEYYINALNNWTWRIYTLFNQQNVKQPFDYYRLDKLENWANGMHALGEIPSTSDSLLLARSWEDSQYLNLKTRNSQSGLHFYYNKQTDSTYTWIRFHLPFYVRTERLNYQHAATDTCATRTKVFLDGNINSTFAWKKWKRVLDINFWHNTILPEMNDMVVYDQSNPLSIVLANSHLKTGHKWATSILYQHRFTDIYNSFSVSMDYWYQSNPVITGYSYNRQTGAYAFQKQNADDAWNAKLRAGISGAIDKKQHWMLGINNQVVWTGSQIMELQDGQEKSKLFGLRTFNYSAQGSVNYRNGDFATGMLGNFGYFTNSYQQAVRENYHTVNYDFTYFINYTIPVLAVYIGSSFAWNHLQNSLVYVPNQNFKVWNVTMSRSFLKGKKLTAKLTAYDLLNSVTHYSYSYSANSFSANTIDRIGRYVMLSLSYKINVNPKKN